MTAFRSSMPVTGMSDSSTCVPIASHFQALLLLLRHETAWPFATHVMSCPEDAGGGMGRTTGSLWSQTQPEDCGLCHGHCLPGSQGSGLLGGYSRASEVNPEVQETPCHTGQLSPKRDKKKHKNPLPLHPKVDYESMQCWGGVNKEFGISRYKQLCIK